MDSKKIKILIFLVLFVVLVLDASTTYSKYVSSASDDMSLTVAKWKILINNSDITTGTSTSMNISPQLFNSSNVKSGTIAPGSMGYFEVIIDPSAVETSFSYEINFTTASNDVADFHPVRYKLVESSTDGALGTAATTDITSTTLPTNVYAMGSTNKITGNKTISDTAYSKIQIRVYFEWLEGTGETLNDTADTAIGHNAVDTTKYGKINVSATFSQTI